MRQCARPAASIIIVIISMPIIMIIMKGMPLLDDGHDHPDPDDYDHHEDGAPACQ